MKKQYDVCIYTFDWETIASFATFEEAEKFAKNEFNKTHCDIAIFHGDDFVAEFKA